MRFTLLDRIVSLTPGERIEAVKTLSLAEEYLADHFPLFPVMPGVLMVEALTQAGAWLVRATEDFAHSMVVLKEARNVKFADFVKPGQVLVLTAEVLEHKERETRLKVQGCVGETVCVSARLVLSRYNLSDADPRQRGVDGRVCTEMRRLFELLNRPAEMPASESQPDGIEGVIATGGAAMKT